ncbi:hypothetical protein G5B37_07775 [Rasiella rasia]|uniref:Uncharacterized protein n=1 Tax=Rasiella rasia TaxID=2744027 RepID=A0A6G6GLK8_9FLAO|nr:hypothetical protein [Rasiella rasia]QIE59465.1 hypothetical protein G5B37_07775 [Rasiella rasia]
MKRFSLLLCSFLCLSCQYFDTEKISAETFYQEELKTIDWAEVDRYPAFAACDTLSEKPSQKDCFEAELGAYLRQTIVNQKIEAVKDIHDTIVVHFSISEKAIISVQSIKMDSVLVREFPHLKDTLQRDLDATKLIAPAYKRGVPVITTFTLPIVVLTDEL